ncbi:MAG: response regulator [Chitinivibrionales bacterium]|nr:response regulator [Chitinivibrionales bacterium]MBD3358246.1 response regulator [Chitinivibrionales bacterium]
MKVLLVDDSATMRRIQATQLANLGVSNIVQAVDGEDGLDKLSESMPVDFILLDWNMPNMDGMTFLKEVRKNGSYSSVKIIMCTSESEKGKVVDALKAGANNYMVKPFTPDTLKEKMGL